MKLELAFDAVFAKPNADADADDGPARKVWHVESEHDDGENDHGDGPMTLAEIGRLVETGRVQPSTLVWRNGFSSWQRADEVEEINALFAAPPIPQRQHAQQRRSTEALAALVEAELKRTDDEIERAATVDVTDAVESDEHFPPSIDSLPVFAPHVSSPSATSEKSAFSVAAIVAGAIITVAMAVAVGVVVAMLFMQPVSVPAPALAPAPVPAPAPAAAAAPAPAPTVVWRDGVAYLVDASGREQALTPPAPAPAPAPAPGLAAVPAPPAPTPAPTLAPVSAAEDVTEPAIKPVKPIKPVKRPVTTCDADLGLGCGEAKPERVELSPTDVLVVARTNLASIRACGQRFGATGIARVGWRVLPNGKAVDIKNLDALGNTPTGTCVVAAIESWRFPTSTKDTLVKSLPLPFK